jgi:hydroxymethylglutaryl-CoA reductase (NADPH)
MNLRSLKSVSARRTALEKKLQIKLANIGCPYADEKNAQTKNCENMIGIVQIPLGIAGPLQLRSGLSAKSVFVPLATTEGALVASVNRGCKAISLSGGAICGVEKIGVTRGPVFKIAGADKRIEFGLFLTKNLDHFQKITEKTDEHIHLKDFETSCIGNNFYIRFIFDTDFAMGMNMATIATEKISEFIKVKTKTKCLSVSGNYCIDKKPAWLNFIGGRGYRAWAEVTLTQKVLKDILKTTPQKIYDVWLSKCILGSIAAGSMGFNAQYANIIAAVFIATGQDPAHVVEGSLGVTTAEIEGKNLKVFVDIPDLMLGIVGGGTGLATQKECLLLLGVKNPEDLARIIAGSVLAGEISLLASLSQNTLAKAHAKLARGESIK